MNIRIKDNIFENQSTVDYLREHFHPGYCNERKKLISRIPKNIEPKGTFIITGSTSGIGLDCVLMALRSGYRVIGIDINDVNLSTLFETDRVSTYQADITSVEQLHEALTDFDLMDDKLYLVCAAGVYHDSNLELCIAVNYTGTINTVNLVREKFEPNLTGISIVGSDQSYFNKNSQKDYGNPYMKSKVLLREFYESNSSQVSFPYSFIAPATVITALTEKVFAQDNQILQNWTDENQSIPEGLLNPHFLAYLIVNSIISNSNVVSKELMRTVDGRRGILLDGGLNDKSNSIVLSEDFVRFSLKTDGNYAVPVYEFLKFCE